MFIRVLKYWFMPWRIFTLVRSNDDLLLDIETAIEQRDQARKWARKAMLGESSNE